MVISLGLYLPSQWHVHLLLASIIARNMQVKTWQLIYKLSSLSEIARLNLTVGDTLSLLTYCDPGLLKR